MSRGTILGLLAVVFAGTGAAIAQNGSPYGAEYQTCRTPDNTLLYIGQDSTEACPAGLPRVVLRGRGVAGSTGPAGANGAPGRAGTDCITFSGPTPTQDAQPARFCRGDAGAGVIERVGFIGASGASQRYGASTSVAELTTGTATAQCGSREFLLGGGHEISGVDNGVAWKSIAVKSSGALVPNRWTVTVTNFSAERVAVKAWAVCTKFEGPDVNVPPGG